MIYDFSHISFVCCGFVTNCQKKWEIVRTYVEHVKNICHELANPLIKHILLVIG